MVRVDCFHCGEPVPPGIDLRVTLGGERRQVCCEGCRAAAEFIRDAGLADYYRFRAAPGPRPENVADDAWATYDRPEIQARLVTTSGGTSSVKLLLEGMRCPACSWLVERRLERAPGVACVAVNPASGVGDIFFVGEPVGKTTIIGPSCGGIAVRSASTNGISSGAELATAVPIIPNMANK